MRMGSLAPRNIGTKQRTGHLYQSGIDEYPDVFLDIPGLSITFIHPLVVIIKIPLCPTPLVLREVIVQKMLQLKLIEESTSPWRSPPLFGAKIRWVGDVLHRF